MTNIPDGIIKFIAKWAVATEQSPEVASKKFWDLMINPDISEEGRMEMIDKWAKEADFDFRNKEE